MKVAIIEDNEIDRLNLRTLLEGHPGVEIAGEAATLEEAVTLLERERPDAIFLDVCLGRQKGFKVLEHVRVHPLVVITTSHPEFALKSFDVEAVDYILKPVEEEALARAVQRLMKRGAQSETPRLEPADMQMFMASDGMQLVPVEQIQAIVGDRIYTRVLVRDGREFLHNRPLREWRRLLPEKTFKTLDRSTIVNLREIASVSEAGGCSCRQVGFRDSMHKLCLGETALKALRELVT